MNNAETSFSSVDISILIVGYGSIGSRHAKNLEALGYANVTVYDPAIARVGDRRHIEMLDEAALRQFKTVFICNPSALHVPTALMAAKAGCDMFIEKPLAADVSGIADLSRVVREKKLVAMVACNYLFNDGFERLRETIMSGALGKPLTALAVMGNDAAVSRPGVDYRETYIADPLSGGVIMDSGPHAVQYLSALFGDVTAVLARAGHRSAIDIPREDSAEAILTHASGVESVVVLDYFSKPKRHTLAVQCERGRIEWDFVRNTVRIAEAPEYAWRDEAVYPGLDKDTARNAMYLEEASHFMRSVATRERPAQGLDDARKVVEVLLAMQASAHNNAGYGQTL